MFSFFKEQGSIEHDIAQLSSFSAETRMESAKSLAISIKEPILRLDIIRLGGVARLARLLSRDGNEDVQEYALIALHNLACSDDIAAKTALVQAGCISLFVRSLSDDSYAKHFKSKQQRRAAAAIAALAFKNPTNQNAIAQAGAIKPLVHLLSKYTYPEIQRYSVLALRNLAFNNTKNQAAIAQAGGVQGFLRVLRVSSIDDNNTTPQNAMSMLFLLTKDNLANQELILNYRDFQMLQHYSAAIQFDPETKSLASQILNYPLIQSCKYSAKLNTPPYETTIKSSTHTSDLSSIGYSVSSHEPSFIEEWTVRQGEREAEEARQKERDDYRGRQVEKLEFWKYQREMAGGGVEPSDREDRYQSKIDKHDGSSSECRIS
jgi:hypothetical protein